MLWVRAWVVRGSSNVGRWRWRTQEAVEAAVKRECRGDASVRGAAAAVRERCGTDMILNSLMDHIVHFALT